MIPITTLEALFAAFNGTDGLADWLQVDPEEVSAWLDAEFIPKGFHYELHCEALDRGFDIHRSVFGVANKANNAD